GEGAGLEPGVGAGVPAAVAANASDDDGERIGRPCAGVAASRPEATSSSDSSANARSAADWKRSSGRFSRQRITIFAKDAGTDPGSACGAPFITPYCSST